MGRQDHFDEGASEHDWRMQHRPPDPTDDVGAPLHRIEEVMPDIHTHPHYYAYGEPGEAETISQIQRARGNPDAKVRVYRALPAEHAHTGFQPGDWVTTSKEYARQHGRQNDESGRDDWPVIRTTARAGDLWTHGDSMHEFGYHGPSTQAAMPSFKGGRNQEVRQHADGVVRKVQRKPDA
jgi:hypothetical protein